EVLLPCFAVFFFQAEDGIRDFHVTGVQTCALPIWGSISSNARLLERMGSVERVGQPGDRRDFYQLSGCMHARVLEHWTERMRQLRDLMTDALSVPSASDPAVRERLEMKREFFGHMVEELSAAEERWRNRGASGAAREAGIGG